MGKTCGYCGSKIEKINEVQYYCDFCTMTLSGSSVKENGERLHIKKLTYEVDPSHLNKTTPELMVLSTIELLHLLTLARSERSQNYSLMNSSWKAQEVSEDEMFKKLESAAGKEYQKATKKVFVLENLVGQRLGYVPKELISSSWRSICII
ncbi:hypothetical protein NKR17_05210 [Priestia flexa]|uniref:hypothetical protein n=1 Tax=Priestia flexa TaxID=86664 RepID=UPI0020A12EA9|nr:hypothetical protein [Priestia flexa]MCP1188482.1 hypothetical protein [Priestia flexa]